MKKFLYITLGIFLTLSLTGCSNDDEEVFDNTLYHAWTLRAYSNPSLGIYRNEKSGIWLCFRNENSTLQVELGEFSEWSELFLPNGIYPFTSTSNSITVNGITFLYEFKNSDLHLYRQDEENGGYSEFSFRVLPETNPIDWCGTPALPAKR